MTPSSIKKMAVPFLKKRDAAFVGLFGSFANGTAKSSSDVDLLVRFGKKKNLFEVTRIERDLSEKLHRKVDLVTEGALSRHLKPHILREIVTLYGRRS